MSAKRGSAGLRPASASKSHRSQRTPPLLSRADSESNFAPEKSGSRKGLSKFSNASAQAASRSNLSAILTPAGIRARIGCMNRGDNTPLSASARRILLPAPAVGIQTSVSPKSLHLAPPNKTFATCKGKASCPLRKSISAMALSLAFKCYCGFTKRPRSARRATRERSTRGWIFPRFRVAERACRSLNRVP